LLHFYIIRNAIKFIYNNVEIQKVPGEDPRNPRYKVSGVKGRPLITQSGDPREASNARGEERKEGMGLATKI